jgi:hypothetical protein
MPLLLLFCLPCPSSSAFRRRRKHLPVEEAAGPELPAADSHPHRHPTVLSSDGKEDDSPQKERSKADDDEPKPRTPDHDAPNAEDPAAVASERRPHGGWLGIVLCLLLVGAAIGVGIWLCRRRLKPKDRFPTDESLFVSDEYY